MVKADISASAAGFTPMEKPWNGQIFKQDELHKRPNGLSGESVQITTAISENLTNIDGEDLVGKFQVYKTAQTILSKKERPNP